MNRSRSPPPFRDGGNPSNVRFGELTVAAELNDDRRRVPFPGPFVVGESDLPNEPGVGLPGRELLDRGERGGGETEPPAFASVSRNSTHRRENDCKTQTLIRKERYNSDFGLSAHLRLVGLLQIRSSFS
jgi:hypothetical protein